VALADSHTPTFSSHGARSSTLLLFALLFSLCCGVAYAQVPENPVISVPGKLLSDSSQVARSLPRVTAIGAVLDSLATDSLVIDSLSIDSLAIDSLETDSLALEGEKLIAILPLDTVPAPPPSTFALKWDRKDMDPHTPSDIGQSLTKAPGLYPRMRDLYNQPFYVLSPGSNGRDALVLFRGRPLNDPATDAANLSAFPEGEVETVWISPAWNGEGPATSGASIRLDPWHTYPKVPKTRITYRQSFYGLGTVDWRIAQGYGPAFAYHFGINVSEYKGRYANTASKATILRFGAKTFVTNIGMLDFHWLETDLRWAEPFESNASSTKREDFDLALTGGRHAYGNYRELATWYVRSRHGYPGGKEDANRLGIRAQWEPRLSEHQQFMIRGDIERTAARYEATSSGYSPGGDRVVAGATVSDDISSGIFDLKASARAEGARYNSRDSSVPDRSLPRIGGNLSGRVGDTLGVSLLADLTSSWRWPSMDESFGFWSVNSPNRSMDLFAVPEGVSKVYGNPSLKPIGTIWMGAGVQWVSKSGLTTRLNAGQRTWNNRIRVSENVYGLYVYDNIPARTGMELNSLVKVPLPMALSLHSSWTWTDLWETGDPVPETWGWASLRFDNEYYNGQLHVHASVTGEYWGEYTYDGVVEEAEIQLNLLAQIQISHFQVYFGLDNATSRKFDTTPGYPGMHRAELWGVRWIMYN